MDLGIKGKKALITGTGKGIGYGIASILAKEGVHVAIVSRNKGYLEELMSEMGGVENGHYSIVCDLAKEDSPKKVIKELDPSEESFTRIDLFKDPQALEDLYDHLDHLDLGKNSFLNWLSSTIFRNKSH